MNDEPMTAIELAAAKALAREHNMHWSDGTYRMAPEDFTADARAVVAAVRSQIEAEALAAMADRFEAYGTLGGEKAWPFVAEIRMAVQSLSRPTSEETPDA